MRLVLAIREYAAGAAFDHFDNGSTQIFDAVTVEVVGGERAGQRLRILVEPGSPEAARWKHPGDRLTVSIPPDWLEAQVLFAGAFTIEDTP